MMLGELMFSVPSEDKVGKILVDGGTVRGEHPAQLMERTGPRKQLAEAIESIEKHL